LNGTACMLVCPKKKKEEEEEEEEEERIMIERKTP
jgi:hypothetical protein